MSELDTELIFKTLLSQYQEQAKVVFEKTIVIRLRLVSSQSSIITIITTAALSEASPQFYWHDPIANYECCALGANQVFNDLNQAEQFIENHPNKECIKIFSGKSFDGSIDSRWIGFKDFEIFLPSCLIERYNRDLYLTVAIHTSHSPNAQIEDALMSLKNQVILQPFTPSYSRVVTNIETYKLWEKKVYLALQRINENLFTKVVIAQDLHLSSNHPCSPYSLMQSMMQVDSSAVSFMYTPNRDVYFIGRSPEILFQLQNKRVISDSLGGTMPVVDNQEENQRIAEQMMVDLKLRREHEIITSWIIEQFKQISNNVTKWSNPRIMQLPSVQHLHNRVSGIIKKGVSIDLLHQLFHPTPAVCGEPRDIALKFIMETEEVTRGWYAGPIGFLSYNYSEFRVAIRSLLLCGSEVYLFAGAGIVSGSDPELEYQEILRKFKPILDLLVEKEKN